MPKRSSKSKSMTDEERVLYLEQKMLAEQEEQKRKQDLWIQVLTSKMIKEVKFTRKNLNKINYQWLFIMRDLKAKELYRDIEIMSQTFERIIDRKDSVIKELLKDLNESEEQFEMAIRSFFERTDFLIEIQSQELNEMKKKSQIEIEFIKETFDKEMEFLMIAHKINMDEILTIIYGMEKLFIEQESEANIEFLSVRDDIKIRNLEDKQHLRVSLELRVTDLWNQFNIVMTDFEETNGARKRSFDELKEKDEKSAKEIDMQMRKLNILTEKIENQKTAISVNYQYSSSINNAIRQKKEEMNIKFRELKSELKKIQEDMRNDLTKLTVKTNETMICLKKKSEKARQILSFAEMCRKLETEEEKILPYFSSSLTDDEKRELKASQSEHIESDFPEEMKGLDAFENFYKHYNKAALDKLSLEKEKQMLNHENTQLRSILKQYLDGISVNSDVLAQTNPLLIINNRANVRIGQTPSRNSSRNMPDSYHKVVIEAKNHIKNTIY